jgi:hypothetical protein
MPNEEEELTNCCGATFLFETDLCSDCREHADVFVEEECCESKTNGFKCTCIHTNEMSEEEADARHDDYLEGKHEDEKLENNNDSQ